MPLFKSLRSKSSSRKSNASVTTNGNEKDSDFAPHSNSSATYGSVKSVKNGAVTLPSKQSSSPGIPRYTSSPSVHLEKGNGEMVRSFSEIPLNLSRSDGSSDGNPRPSDLFAGKGVQWGAVKLAGPNVTPTPVAGTNTTEDLQNFLKMRRQWKPTFATEEDNEKLANDFQPPKDLTQLSFASGDKVQSQGLMSLKDLEESHKRKERLLSAAPLGGSLWDEAETSKAASARLAKAASSSTKAIVAPKETTNYGKKPENLRKASSQSVSSNKNGRKFFGGQKATPVNSSSAAPQVVAPLAAPQVVPPKRYSSTNAAIASTEKDSGVSEGGALGITNVADTKAAADTKGVPVKVEKIEDTLAVGKDETPSDPLMGEDTDKTLTTDEAEKIPMEKEEGLAATSTIPQELDIENAAEEGSTKPMPLDQVDTVEATPQSTA